MALVECFYLISQFVLILATQNALCLIGGIVNCRFEGGEALVWLLCLRSHDIQNIVSAIHKRNDCLTCVLLLILCMVVESSNLWDLL